MAFFPGSSSSSTPPSATPRTVEEDYGRFNSASSSTGQEYKTIRIFGVSITTRMTETTSTSTTTTTGETGSVSLDFMAVDETIPAVISPNTQGSVVQPVSTTTTGETASVSLDFMAVDETIPAVISPNTQGSVVQPVNLPVHRRDIPMEAQSVSPDLLVQPQPRVNLPVNHHEGYWRIKKTLKKSDVDGSSRLLLGKPLVQVHILPNIENFDKDRGTEITVYDVDTRTVHTLLLKTWITESYVLVHGWMKDFVRRRVLRKNDEIGLRWEETDGRFEFSLLRQHPMHQDSS